MDVNIRNFKDFLQLYNLLSETCFKRCVGNLNLRTLEDHEVKCVEDCSEKFIKLNHRFMSVYVENQQIVTTRRIKEAEEQQAQQQQALEQQMLAQAAVPEEVTLEGNT